MRLSQEVCLHARNLVASRLGLEFREGRQADLERGFVRAFQASAMSSPESYLNWLATLPEDNPGWRRLAGYLTVGETYFFRDRSCFEALEQEVLPALIATRGSEGILRLRLWSAGCATGEEPYSLAILLDRLLPDGPEWAVTILATDINPDALESARIGVYRKWSLRETSSSILERYFLRRAGDTFEVDPRIRKMVTFAPLNLAEDGYPAMVTNTSVMDLILCRNVLMYFTREAQGAAAARLRMALVTGGWLVVSPVEASADLLHPLVPVNLPGSIFYRKLLASSQIEPPSCHRELPAADRPLPPPSVDELEHLLPLPSPVNSRAEVQAGAPPDVEALLRHARTLADQGNLEEARRVCGAAVAQDRLDPEAPLLLAAIFQEMGEIPSALEALRRTLYLSPGSAPAHFLLGSLLRRKGEHARAKRCMETVMNLLSGRPRDEVVSGGDGLTAGRLLETARLYLESR